jgi:hypothetical protein
MEANMSNTAPLTDTDLCGYCDEPYVEPHAPGCPAGVGFAEMRVDAARAIAEARAGADKYPQYVGYFETWVYATIRTDVGGKGRVLLFAAGDVVLADPVSLGGLNWLTISWGPVTAFSMRTGWCCGVPRCCVSIGR